MRRFTSSKDVAIIGSLASIKDAAISRCKGDKEALSIFTESSQLTTERFIGKSVAPIKGKDILRRFNPIKDKIIIRCEIDKTLRIFTNLILISYRKEGASSIKLYCNTGKYYKK